MLGSGELQLLMVSVWFTGIHIGALWAFCVWLVSRVWLGGLWRSRRISNVKVIKNITVIHPAQIRGCTSLLSCEIACGWRTLEKAIPKKNKDVGPGIQWCPFSDLELVWSERRNIGEFVDIHLTQNMPVDWGSELRPEGEHALLNQSHLVSQAPSCGSPPVHKPAFWFLSCWTTSLWRQPWEKES